MKTEKVAIPALILRVPDGRTTSVPHHRGRDLARPFIKEILKKIEIELNSDEYKEYLRKL